MTGLLSISIISISVFRCKQNIASNLHLKTAKEMEEQTELSKLIPGGNSNQEKSLEGISIRTKVVIVYLFNILIFAFCTDNNWTLDSSNTLNWIGFGSLIYSHILWWSHTNDHIYHNITVKITNKCGIRHIVFKMYFYRLITFVLFPCVIFCFETNNGRSIVVTNDFIIYDRMFYLIYASMFPIEFFYVYKDFNKFEKTRNKIKTSDISESNDIDIENDIHSNNNININIIDSITPVTPISSRTNKTINDTSESRSKSDKSDLRMVDQLP